MDFRKWVRSLTVRPVNRTLSHSVTTLSVWLRCRVTALAVERNGTRVEIFALLSCWAACDNEFDSIKVNIRPPDNIMKHHRTLGISNKFIKVYIMVSFACLQWDMFTAIHFKNCLSQLHKKRWLANLSPCHLHKIISYSALAGIRINWFDSSVAGVTCF